MYKKMSGGVLQLLLEKGLPSREVQSATTTEISDLFQTQLFHDNLNMNANLQVDKQDVADDNPLPVKEAVTSATRTAICMLPTQLNNLYILGLGYSPEGQEGRQIFTGSKYVVRIHIACKQSSNGFKFYYFMDSATPLSRTLTDCVASTGVPNQASNETIECGFRVQHGLSVWASSWGIYYKLFDLEGNLVYPYPENTNEGMCITVVVED